MLLSLKYGLISMGQLNSKLGEVPAAIDHPTGDLEHLERKESAWLCRMSRAFLCVQAKTAAERTEDAGPWLGVNGAGIGEKIYFGVLISLPGVLAWWTCCQRRDRRGARAQPGCLACTPVLPELGTAVGMCAVSAVHTEFLYGVTSVDWAGIWLHCFPWLCPECLWRVTSGAFTPYMQSFLSNNPEYLWIWHSMSGVRGLP